MLFTFIISAALAFGASRLVLIIPGSAPYLPKGAWQIAVLAYLLTYLDGSFKRDGHCSKWFQRLFVWRRLVAYFPGRITQACPLENNQQYIFAAFPHGTCTVQHVLTMTDGAHMLSQVHQGDRRDLAASVLFLMPVVRELLLLLGNVDAGKSTAHHNLKKRRSLLIFVGGEAEQLLTKERENKVFLARRLGFIKLALLHGTPLVPMYCFGENETYHVSQALMGFRKWLQRTFHIGVPLCWGRWGSFWPLQVPLDLCIGAPIPVQKVEKHLITNEMIKALHDEFVQSLVKVFEANKERCGLGPDARLQID